MKHTDQVEALFYAKEGNKNVQRVTNINNPSIELHLAPAGKANGVALIIAPGGGNKELWVGPEGVEAAEWFNKLGISGFVLRYRLQPCSSSVDALADTQQAKGSDEGRRDGFFGGRRTGRADHIEF